MNIVLVFVAHHALWLAWMGAAVFLVPSVLTQRRPTGSAMAWLLAMLLLPYVGIPLYLVFGGRKMAARARTKPALPSHREPDRAPPALLGPGPQLLKGALAASVTRLRWLDDGISAYETTLAEIEAARRSIRIVTYVTGNDPTGRTLVEALTRRAREGLEVRLLLDALLAFRAPRRELRQLTAAGGKVVHFMPLVHIPFRGRANLRNHRKISLFDGERAIIGGMNLADEYMGARARADRWQDLALWLEGDVASSLDAVFCADWAFAAGETLSPAALGHTADATPVDVVPSGPDRPDDSIYDLLLQAAFGAKSRVYIATPYFVPDEPLSKSLELAARRGVDVRVVVPARSNHRLADLVGATFLRELARQGVSVRRYRPRMLHAKAVLIDDQIAMVGSANYDLRSLFLDYEVGLLLSSRDEIDWLSRWFARIFADCDTGAPSAGWLEGRLESTARMLAPLV